MDYLYMLVAVPVAALTSVWYSRLIAGVGVINNGRPLTMIRTLSATVLVLIALELAVMFFVGSSKLRILPVPIFQGINVALFFLGVPSLAHLFVLGKEDAPERWKYALFPCTVLAFVLLIMQLAVLDVIEGV